MVENTRAHERLLPLALGGITRSFVGPAGKQVELWVPQGVPSERVVDLVIHFHGAAWLAQQAVAALDTVTVVAVLNFGGGSGAYHRPFADPATFDTLLATITRETAIAAGSAVRIGRITLSGFSAGHGAIRAILLEPRHFAAIDNVLLLDGLHTSYIPEGRALADHGTLDTTNLVALTRFARAAVTNEKRLLVTHSEIFPGTFASTTETADWTLGALGLRRMPVLEWGPRGMQQLGTVRAGQFALRSYAGNSAPDHIDHFHAMPELLRDLLSARRSR